MALELVTNGDPVERWSRRWGAGWVRVPKGRVDEPGPCHIARVRREGDSGDSSHPFHGVERDRPVFVLSDPDRQGHRTFGGVSFVDDAGWATSIRGMHPRDALDPASRLLGSAALERG